MVKKAKMLRDALGEPIPQTLNEDGSYTVISNGAAVGIDFSKHKMLRDALGSPLYYQYFDVELNRFVPGVIGGGHKLTVRDTEPSLEDMEEGEICFIIEG